MSEKVILVDKNDKEIGIEEKIKTHREGRLHRSFSVFIFNSKGELLLQKRASSKYHSGRLWTNTCCSHPRPGESVLEASHRRLKEEMGFDCALKEIFNFTYQTKFENGLSENEYNFVLTGKFDGQPIINPEEASGWKWIKFEELKKDIKENPDKYTFWLKISIDKIIAYLNKKQEAL